MILWSFLTRMSARNTIMFLVTVALVIIQCTPGKQSEEMHVITSRDGTDIAYEKVGNGPALILVGGALASRADHDKLVEHLSEKFPCIILIDEGGVIVVIKNHMR